MTWKRVATAAVLIPGVVGLVLWGSTAIVALATGLVILLALFEYFALGDAIGHRAYRFWTATCALFLIYQQWLMGDVPTGRLSGGIAVTLRSWWFGGGLPSFEGVFFVFVLGIAAAGRSASGLILVAFPLSFAVRLHGTGREGPVLLLFTLVIIWVGDTAAYFVGRAIGKHPLAPHLSPKKTWEGTVASFFGSLAVGLIFARFLTVPLPHLLAMAAWGNVAGQVGDLLESAFKRSAGVKDSGALLPGHGGVLDRIDALILAIPVVWYYWLIFSQRW